MKCPFELPVKKEKFLNTRPRLYRIGKLIFPYTEEEANYLVAAINCHEKLIELLKVALCPNVVNGCQAGIMPNSYGEMEECQWCSEKKQAIEGE